MSSVQQKWWDEALLQQARMFVPSEECLARGRSIADRIFRALKMHSKYTIGRAEIAGSVEKDTSLSIDIDYDCIIFVNDIRPPFDNIVDDFEEVIMRHVENAKLTLKYPGKGLLFMVDGLKFDVVPAIHFSYDSDTQRRRIMEEIRKYPRPAIAGNHFSSSLCQVAVEFIKKQSTFTHDVIRLVKFWNKTILITDRISGRSTIIEIIATYVAKEEEQKSSSPSLLRAFTSFLEKMKNMQSLYIIFDDFYQFHEITDFTKRQRPLILDPLNKYNNFGHIFSRRSFLMEIFRKYATTTLGRLSIDHNNISDGLIHLFKAQPEIAPRDLVERYLFKRNIPPYAMRLSPNVPSYAISVTRSSNDSIPKMVIHNEKVIDDNKLGVDILKHYFLGNARLVNDRDLPDDDKTREEIRNEVSKVINENIYGYSVAINFTSNFDKSEIDVSFEIPCGLSLVTVDVKW